MDRHPLPSISATVLLNRPRVGSRLIVRDRTTAPLWRVVQPFPASVTSPTRVPVRCQNLADFPAANGSSVSWIDNDDRTLGESGLLTPHREPRYQENRGAVFPWPVVDHTLTRTSYFSKSPKTLCTEGSCPAYEVPPPPCAVSK